MIQRQINFTSLDGSLDQTLLKMFVEATKTSFSNTRVFHAKNVYLIAPRSAVKFNRTVIIYRSKKNPERFRAALWDPWKVPIGAGSHGTLYFDLDTLQFQDDDPDKPMIVKQKRPGKIRVLKVSVKKAGYTMERFVFSTQRESAFLCDPELGDAYLHGKEVVYDGHMAYQLMHFIEGVPLSVFIANEARNTPLSVLVNAARHLIQSAMCLVRRGVTHRDFKPDNLIIQPDGVVKIVDFGLATRDVKVSCAGTRSYMAPQQLALRGFHSPHFISDTDPEYLQDPKSDWYSLGMIIAEMFGGINLRHAQSDKDVLGAYRYHALPNDPDPNYPLDLSRVPAPICVLVEHMTRVKKEERLTLDRAHGFLTAFLAHPDFPVHAQHYFDQIAVCAAHVFPDDEALVDKDHFNAWTQALGELQRTMLTAGVLKINLVVLGALIDYIDTYATDKTIRKRTRAASVRRVEDVKQIIGIVLDPLAQGEKREVIQAKLDFTRRGFFGRSELCTYVQNAINSCEILGENPNPRA